MSDVAIRAEHLSKRYRLGKAEARADSLVGATVSWLRSPLANLRSLRALSRFQAGEGGPDVLWALRDASFEVREGEVVGLIGSNGAGKSTLLKVLSRITEPTSGRATIRGRVASLLEVGTGFHPELTGRENVYLNGTLLGMRRAEVDRKFDEIVAFAEVERFIDTPVKRYSSGMQVRLAFAVAAHLEPEILIIDEVLAVGDAAFQRKCLGKMGEVSRGGRTVLFVSHNMGALSALCTRGILLKRGTVVFDGPTDEAVSAYLRHGTTARAEVRAEGPPAPGQKLKNRALRVLGPLREPAAELDNAHTAFVEVEFEVLEPGRGYDVGFELHHHQYGPILSSSWKDVRLDSWSERQWARGHYRFEAELPMAILRGGDYRLTVGAAIPKFEWLDVLDAEVTFAVSDSTSPVALTGEGRRGAVLPVLRWRERPAVGGDGADADGPGAVRPGEGSAEEAAPDRAGRGPEARWRT